MSLRASSLNDDANLARRLDEGLRRDHRDFLYYILRQNEKGAVRRDEVILNSALFM